MDQCGKQVTCSLRICTGKPYVKKLMLKVRKTAPLNKTLVCLTPDLQITMSSVHLTRAKKISACNSIPYALSWLFTP
jgi:hypothetical protein